jgi:Ca2+-binding EF-hand superfamily protein
MDQDRDGTVSLDDLKEVYASLGNKIKNKIFFLLMYCFF